MIWQLMKLDPAWVWLPFVMLACGVWGALNGGFAFWNLLLIAGVLAADRQPDTQFHGPLPMTVRPLLIERCLAALALLWLPLMVGGFFLSLNHSAGVTSGTVLAFGSVMSLVMIWLQTTRIKGRTGSEWLAAVPFLVWTGFAINQTLLSEKTSEWTVWLSRETDRTGIAIALICLPAGALFFVRAYLTAPKSFVVQEKARVVKASSAARPKRALRMTFTFGYVWIMFLLIGLLAGVRPASFVSVVLWIYFGTAWTGIREKIRWLTFLPVRPDALLAAVLLPGVLAVATGYAVGTRLPAEQWPWLQSTGSGEIFLRPLTGCQPKIVPPDDFLEPLRSSKAAPAIVAPWGETFQPAVQSVDGIGVYNPWAVGCNNTGQFFDWQLARATTAVYGAPIPREELSGRVHAVEPIRSQLLNIIFLAVTLILLLLGTMSQDWYRARRLGIPAFVIVGLSVGPCAMLFFSRSDIVRVASWSLPSNLAAATALAIVPLLLVYWLTYRMFRQLEFIGPQTANAGRA